MGSRASIILLEAKIFILYHGSRHGDKIEKAGRFTLSRDEANAYPGISFTSEPGSALDYGDELFKVWVSLQRPLEVDYDFWQGKSKKSEHQEVYSQLKDSGVNLKRGSITKWVGGVSKVAHSMGYDGMYTHNCGFHLSSVMPKGKVGEMRVFTPKVITKFERVRRQSESHKETL